MRVLMVTPAPRGSRSGNRLTALRWATHLRALGHEVELLDSAEPTIELDGDLLVALHAEKSAGALHRWCEGDNPKPSVLVMTGTDLYATEDLSEVALGSCARADRIVVLHPGALDRLPAELHARVHCIPQSATAPTTPRERADDRFLALSLAHLRPVKDPLLLARAARRSPDDSKLLVQLAGASADDDLADLVRAEERENERFQWIGALNHKDAMERLASADLLVVTSRNEGGPAVVPEAIACGVGILSTDMPAARALLGPDHPGLYPVGDDEALAELLQRAETSESFRDALRRASRDLRAQVDPDHECERIAALLCDLPRTR